MRCHVFPTEHSQNFSQILSVQTGDVSKSLLPITTHKRVEVVYFVFFRELIVDFQTFSEQIFKQFEFLWLTVKGGHCLCEGLRQFRDFVDIVVETG